MPGRRGTLIAVAAMALAAAAAAGCGSSAEVVRIGLLSDCQGPFRGLEGGMISAAELPFLRRGSRLVGTSPSSGVAPIEIGHRRVELVHGCMESGEHTVFIEEARRLIEAEHVDVIVGGATVAARDLARRYPDVPFISTFWNEQEVTLRRPSSNLFRFGPDYGQNAAGLGSYAYRTLGWRRTAVVAGDGPAGWGGAAAFVAEFCALGGTVVQTAYRSPFTGEPDVARKALDARADGIAAFLTFFDDPVHVLGDVLQELQHPSRQLVLWSETLEDGELLTALGPKLDGVSGTSWLPASPPSPTLRDYRKRYAAAFPGQPVLLADQSWVIGFHNAVEATLTALERLGSAAVRDGLQAELSGLQVDLPGGRVSLDANRQAVRDGYMSRVVADGGNVRLEPVAVVPQVEQTFAGLLSKAPPPGPDSQPCVKATPPPWAR